MSAVRVLIACTTVFGAPSGVVAATALSDQAILEKVDAAMVQIVTDSGTGSGFVLNAQGYVATNHHVVEGSSTIAVKQGSRSAPAAYVWASGSLDLAVIRTNLDGLEPVVLAVSPPPVLADVIAFGYPGVSRTFDASGNVEPTHTKGNVNRNVYWGSWEDGGEQMQIVEHSAQVNPGNSGGPLVDGCGRVVGVNTAAPLVSLGGGVRVARATGVYWASFIAELAEELNSLGISYGSERGPCEAPPPVAGPSSEAVDDLRRQIEEQERAIEESERQRSEADANRQAETQAQRAEFEAQQAESEARRAEAEAKLEELQAQLQGALATQQEEADRSAQRDAELASFQEQVAGRLLTIILIGAGSVLVLGLIGFLAFASFRRTVLQAAMRVRTGASRIVSSSRRQERALPKEVAAQPKSVVLRIGRGHDMDVTLQSEQVSRFHAELEVKESSFRLTDKGSTNGTRVFRNGRWQAISSTDYVQAQERLELGDVRTTATDLERMAARPVPSAASGSSNERARDDRPQGPVRRDARGRVVPN